MKNNIKIEKTLQVINQIVEDPLLHLPFASNIIAAIKPLMVKSEIRGFPILCLIGPPQSGKSTVARAIVINRNNTSSDYMENSPENMNFYIITDINVSLLKKILRKRPSDYVVLDDFALFQDSDTRRKANRFFDEVVRPSHAGTSSLLLLTAESGALDKISGSLHGRMIKLYMNDWKYDPNHSQLLENLLDCQATLCSILQDFSKWALNQNQDIRSRFLQFQEKYRSKTDDRSISMFFCFDFAMEAFSKYLAEHYDTSFSINTFQSSYMNVWKKNRLRNLNNAELLKYLFDKLLEEGAFSCKIPETRQLCKNYCSGVCSKDCIRSCNGITEYCDPDSEFYYDNPDHISDNYYDPYEMLMDDQNDSAILVTNCNYIFGMPAYKQLSAPLFIVGKNNLVNMINNALEKFCIEMRVEHICFKPKEISSLLNENGMCVSRITGDHMCYTFPYMTANSFKDLSVYVLRINMDEYKMICKQNKKETSNAMEYLQKNSPYRYSPPIPQKLIQLCKELQWRYESTDSYTKEKYTDIRP